MPVVTLAREYPSIHGAPVIRSVDTDIFALRYFMRCMACGFCKDQCCSHGVDIDVENARRLKALGLEFEAFVGLPQSIWFTAAETPDAEFPSGAHMRTQVKDGGCVFLNRQTRGCKIHAWCIDKGIDYHTLKPMVSILFPATFDYGVLGPSSEVRDKSLICAGEGESVYDGVRDELRYFFGDGLIGELDSLKSDALCA